jgi:hypothetical protein
MGNASMAELGDEKATKFRHRRSKMISPLSVRTVAIELEIQTHNW